LWLIARLNRAMPLMRGFVWYEQGRLVGNVSLAPSGYDHGWIVANVAVYPEFRRQGIARQLMQAALGWIDKRNTLAILQVDADNPGAHALYDSLGFLTQRTFTRWRRAGYLRPPDALNDPPEIRRGTWHDAPLLADLAARVRPDEQGGMGWLRPNRRADFHPSSRASIQFALGGQHAESWIIPGTRGDILAALRIEERLGLLTTVFDLLVQPDQQGQLEAPLVNFALREVVGRRTPLVTEHPADDQAACAVLQQNYFRAERTLVHMLRPRQQERKVRP
jgi:RimJ/RimL family protein N-acetyltransferase